jgi:hypothetical protein
MFDPYLIRVVNEVDQEEFKEIFHGWLGTFGE